jgi:hypothetical protein
MAAVEMLDVLAREPALQMQARRRVDCHPVCQMCIR